MNSKLPSYFQLTRPINLILGVLSIFIGAFITGTIQPLANVLLACISGGLVMAGGYVINDYFDVEIDRANKPWRPLSSNQVKIQEAVIFSIILFVLGIFLSIFIHSIAFLVAVFTSLGLILYSAKLKRTVLLGNLAVSLFSALAFVYGALSVGRWRASLIPAGFAFLFHLGREIIKDVEDLSGDEACSAHTLPVRFGQKAAFVMATWVFAILIVFTFLPYLFGIYGKGYFWIVLIGVDLVLILTLVLIWSRPVGYNLARISMILKADMFVGLTAIYVGTPN
ncbi:MAG: geranylgeranylglycerol-phosphate geranylgeranyltransferase [bacterium]